VGRKIDYAILAKRKALDSGLAGIGAQMNVGGGYAELLSYHAAPANNPDGREYSAATLRPAGDPTRVPRLANRLSEYPINSRLQSVPSPLIAYDAASANNPCYCFEKT
jgi:hypothetical protein